MVFFWLSQWRESPQREIGRKIKGGTQTNNKWFQILPPTTETSIWIIYGTKISLPCIKENYMFSIKNKYTRETDTKICGINHFILLWFCAIHNNKCNVNFWTHIREIWSQTIKMLNFKSLSKHIKVILQYPNYALKMITCKRRWM